jgi:hypothetical protein
LKIQRKAIEHGKLKGFFFLGVVVGMSNSKDRDIHDQIKEIGEEARKRKMIATETHQKFVQIADIAQEKELKEPDILKKEFLTFQKEVAENLAAVQFDLSTIWQDIESLAKMHYASARTARMQFACISKVALELDNKPELIDYIKEQAKENNRILRSLLEE